MMTLEDFFTLTEIKNGLTAPIRVEELINVMRKEKDCFVKNIGDATRHWAAVASTISATENKDCLDLFIQLDGLSFIQRWLKDAQKFSNDTNDSIVEESIVVLLQALKKLHITAEKSISSGILFTVKSLYENTDHSESRFGKELSGLLDRWTREMDEKALHGDAENVGVHLDDENSKLAYEEGRSSASCAPVSRELGSDEKQVSEPVREKILASGCSDALHQDNIEDSKAQSQRNELDPQLMSGNSVGIDRSPDLSTNSAVMSVPVLEDVLKKEETPLCSVGETLTNEACSFPVTREGIDDEHRDGSEKLNELPGFENQGHNKIDGSSGRSCVTEKSDVSSQSPLQEPGAVLEGFDAANVEESAKEIAPVLHNNVDFDNAGVCQLSSSLDSERVSTLDSTSGMSDKRINYSSPPGFKSAGQDGKQYRNVFSMNGNIMGKFDDFGASFSRRENFRSINGDRQRRRKEDGDLRTDSEFSKARLNSKASNIIDKRSDMDLEYGIVDALEVARQVAQEVLAEEVEREVVEYREPSCSSSSDKVSEDGIRQLGKPDTWTEKQDLLTELQGREEVQSAKSHVAESYSDGETCLTHPDNLDTQPENLNEMESSLVTEAAQGADASTEKGFCEFDLNQVFNDDTDQLATPVSLPVSVISVSRPAIASGLPLTPLQFEGTLGWKGSAATSAFRPASPRKVLDGDRTLSSGGNSDSSKQRQDFLDFDLNVAETGDESRKQNSVPSLLPTGESLAEGAQRRSGGFKLDLNSFGDDVDAPVSDLREGLFNNPICYSASPACSSSSTQPLVRNIDLNDRPYVHGDAADQGPLKFCQNACGGSKTDASVISIMGTRVEVSRKDFALHAPSLPNGRTIEPAMGATLARTGGDVLGINSAMSYHQTPFMGYNGLTVGPTISFSTMYEPSGSIPYMVDSRGAAVMPQIMGPMSAVPASSYSHPPFIMNMTDAQLTPNGVAHPRPKFDLNSCSSDSGGLKQFLFPGHVRSMEEQLRTNVQSSSSGVGVGGKRKEPDGPDGGWEGGYLLSYKHQQPPWKQ